MSDPSNEQKSAGDATKAGMAKAADAARQVGAQSKRAFEKSVGYSSRLSPATLAWWGIAFAIVLLLTSNLLVGTWFKNWRADLTEDNLYSITDSTRKVLSSIDEPINVTLYYTKALGEQAPIYGTYFERVRALLERYRDMSGGKLQLSFVNPLAFSDAEDRAVGSGLRGIRLNQEGDMAYFGLVATNTTDNQETVGFFSPDRERFLEYDLTKLVHTLSKPKKKVVGLISGLPLEGAPGNPMMGGQPMPPWTILSQIRDFFEIKSLQQDVAEIPADIDTLMLVQPTQLTPKAAYAIDQFALKGGRILAFVDPVAEVGRMLQRGRDVGETTELNKLLAKWGIAYDGKKVAADIVHARRVQFGGGQGGQPSVTEYVAWLGLDRRTMDAGNALTAGIETLNSASMGILSSADKARTKLEPILQTSARSEIIEADKVSLRPDPLALLNSYKPGGKRLTIAARVSGDITTAFPGGPPKEEKKDSKDGDKKDGKADGKTPDAKKDEKAAEAPKPDAAKAKDDKAADAKDATAGETKDADKQDGKAAAKDSKAAATDAKPAPGQLTAGKLNAIIVADTDILHDQFWLDERDFLGQRVQIPLAHNSVFVVNLIENLTGGEALRDLRGRGVKARPFTVVDNIRRDAEKRFREREQALEAKLKDTQSKLSGIEQKGEGGKVILSDKDRETIEKFRAEMLSTRRELRNVKLAMRQDIDRLDATLKFANIAAVPLLIGFGAIGLALFRRRSDKAAREGSSRQ